MPLPRRRRRRMKPCRPAEGLQTFTGRKQRASLHTGELQRWCTCLHTRGLPRLSRQAGRHHQLCQCCCGCPKPTTCEGQTHLLRRRPSGKRSSTTVQRFMRIGSTCFCVLSISCSSNPSTSTVIRRFASPTVTLLNTTSGRLDSRMVQACGATQARLVATEWRVTNYWKSWRQGKRVISRTSYI